MVGCVRRDGDGFLRAAMSYVLPQGAKMSLVERGGGVQRTLDARVEGRDCPAPARPTAARRAATRSASAPLTAPGGAARSWP